MWFLARAVRSDTVPELEPIVRGEPLGEFERLGAEHGELT